MADVTTPVVTSFATLAPLIIQEYENYLPTAFDGSLTMLQKVNLIIQSISTSNTTLNNLINQWNTEIVPYVNGSGFQTDVNNKLDSMSTDGTLASLISQDILGNLSTLKTNDKSTIVNAVNENYNHLANVDTQLADIANIPSSITADLIMSALQTNKKCYIPDGTYTLNKTIVMPIQTELVLSKNAVLIPSGDFDVIQMGQQCRLSGGTINVSSVSTFSHSAIHIGTSGTNFRIKVEDINLISYGQRGYGINDEETATNAYSTSNQFIGVSIQNFNIGIRFYSTGSCYTTAHLFIGEIWGCVNSIWGNTFSGCRFLGIGEAGPTTDVTQPAIYCNGVQNDFNIYVYDVGNTGLNQIYCQFDSNSKHNSLNVGFDNVAKLVVDYGQFNQTSEKISQNFARLLPSVAWANNSTIMVGNQDNCLAFADKKYTVTFSGQAVLRSGRLTSDIFTPLPSINGISYTIWDITDTVNDRLIIDITGISDINNLSTLGVLFGSIPCKYVKLEFYNNVQAQWHTLEITNNIAGYSLYKVLEQQLPSTSDYLYVSEIKITLGQPTSGTTIQLRSVFGSAGTGGSAWLPRGGGNQYGDVTFNTSSIGPILKDTTNGHTYRLQMVNGVLTPQQVT